MILVSPPSCARFGTVWRTGIAGVASTNGLNACVELGTGADIEETDIWSEARERICVQ